MLFLGASSLGGGLIGAVLGFRTAVALVEPIKIEDPWNLIGATIVLIWPLLVAGVSTLLGYLAGVILTTTLLLGIRNDATTGLTLAYLMALMAVVVPLAVWLIITISNRWDAAAGPALVAGALLVGGILPGVAYLLASRSRPRRPQQESPA